MRPAPELVTRITTAVLARGGQRQGRELRFRCVEPANHANGDADPSARWNPDKAVWWCDVCGAGGGAVDLAKRLGIDLGDHREAARLPILDGLASERKLPVPLLRDVFGLRAVVYQNRPAFRYPTALGIDRIKFGDGKKPKYTWTKTGGHTHWYNLDRAMGLLRADAEVLYIVNGEPSVWACTSRGVAAVCLCGERVKITETLIAALREALAAAGLATVSVRIAYDTDDAGRRGAVAGVAAFRAQAWDDVVALDLRAALPDVVGADVDDLHRRVGDGLAEALAGMGLLVEFVAGASGSEDGNARLPTILVTDRPLRDMTADALAALTRANMPPEVFARLGKLARVRSDEHGRPVIDIATESIVRHRLARVADFVRIRNGKRLPVPPPVAVVQDLLAHGEWPELPPLEAVSEVPILRADGSVFHEPGYDPETRLVYAPPPGLVMPPIPLSPTASEIRAARSTIIDIISDFPFRDGAGVANTLALLLTPVMRPTIPGPVPLALIDKPKRGTGATLLALVAEAIAIGKVTDLMTAPREEEEWRKKITAALLAGMTILFFDNVDHTLLSPNLSAALTAPEWSDRILGKSEMARSLPLRVTWMVTGNNVRVGGDIARRSYWIRLDAQVARPWQRDGFRHENLLAHVLRDRGRFLAAILTLARAWFAAGSPKAAVPKLGGFEGWAGTVGGVLAHVGIPDFLANLDTLYSQVDEDEVGWEAFLAAWARQHGDHVLTVAEIVADVKQEQHPLRTALPPDLAAALVLDGKGKANFERRLGKALGKRADGVYGSLRLERAGKDEHANVARWRVVEAPAGGFRGFADLFPAGSQDQSDEGVDTASEPPEVGGNGAANPPNPPNPLRPSVEPTGSGVARRTVML